MEKTETEKNEKFNDASCNTDRTSEFLSSLSNVRTDETNNKKESNEKYCAEPTTSSSPLEICNKAIIQEELNDEVRPKQTVQEDGKNMPMQNDIKLCGKKEHWNQACQCRTIHKKSIQNVEWSKHNENMFAKEKNRSCAGVKYNSLELPSKINEDKCCDTKKQLYWKNFAMHGTEIVKPTNGFLEKNKVEMSPKNSMIKFSSTGKRFSPDISKKLINADEIQIKYTEDCTTRNFVKKCGALGNV